jgi:hypothetical protein
VSATSSARSQSGRCRSRTVSLRLPLTRSRARAGNAPNKLNALYYAQLHSREKNAVAGPGCRSAIAIDAAPARTLLIRQRTIALCVHLFECGVIAPEGLRNVEDESAGLGG